MHIHSQKYILDIFTVGNLQNIFMEHDIYLCPNDFWYKRKILNFDPYNVLLAIATNISLVLWSRVTYIYIYIYIYVCIYTYWNKINWCHIYLSLYL